MGRKQKSTSISSKTTPEQNKAILILLDNLKQHEALKITKIKEEYLHSGFKGFLHKKITKSMIPKGQNWAWNQSNARIIYPLTSSLTVTLFKLNPRRLTETTTSPKKSKNKKNNDKKHKRNKRKDDDSDDSDEELSHQSYDSNYDEDDIENAKPSYKLWIYQINTMDESAMNNLDMHNDHDNKKNKKKKSNSSNNATSTNNNVAIDIRSIMGERYNSSSNDNFVVSFLWCEKGRTPPSSPILPNSNHNTIDNNLDSCSSDDNMENNTHNNNLKYRNNQNISPDSSPCYSSSPSPPSSPLLSHPSNLQRPMKNNNFASQSNNIESKLDNKQHSMMNNIHLNNLFVNSNNNNNNNNLVNQNLHNGNNNQASSFAVPFIHHVNQKVNISHPSNYNDLSHQTSMNFNCNDNNNFYNNPNFYFLNDDKATPSYHCVNPAAFFTPRSSYENYSDFDFSTYSNHVFNTNFNTNFNNDIKLSFEPNVIPNYQSTEEWIHYNDKLNNIMSSFGYLPERHPFDELFQDSC